LGWDKFRLYALRCAVEQAQRGEKYDFFPLNMLQLARRIVAI
jgi:hypothetical protein